MNNQLIKKVIKSNENETNVCPEFTYENPLLDRNVAKALSKSFVKILRISQQNSKINNNLRHSVLSNIRKMCRLQPEKHVEIEENVTNLLTEVYIDEAKNLRIDTVEKNLDDFLIRRLDDLDLNSNYPSTLKPEIAQSLINLNANIEIISQNVLNINVKSLTLVKDLWTNPSVCERLSSVCDIAMRMKPELEIMLVDSCHDLLTEQKNLKEVFYSNCLKDIIHKCTVSPQCFQLCCGVINNLFITANYSSCMQLFITEFVRQVKKVCSNRISVLYPKHLCIVVVLLDFDLEALPEKLRNSYIENTLPYLNKVNSDSKSDLALLLSHYPEWFDIYFAQ